MWVSVPPETIRIPPIFQYRRQGAGVGTNRRGVVSEFGLQRLAQANGFCCYHLRVDRPLNAREHGGLKPFEPVFLVGQNQSTARTSQGLGRRAGHNISVREGRGVHPTSDQPGNVRHVHVEPGHQLRARSGP